MQTIILDGKEYALIPKEQLREIPQPIKNIQDSSTKSILDEFLEESNVEIARPLVDDGLMDNKEKRNAIKVIDNPQDLVVRQEIIYAPPAKPKPYEYRERYLKKELLASDIMTFSRISSATISGNPEDPMIKADEKKPKSMRLFYGPGGEQE